MTRPIAFMFPGQGAQFPGMAVGLYGTDRPFTETMDRVFACFGHGADLRRTWLARSATDWFDDVTVAQPLLYGIDCAVAASLAARGVFPSALIGHSVGEIAAAQVAGVVDLETGCSWIARLIEWCRGVPAGGMLAVAASVARVEPFLRGNVVVGAVNAQRQVLVAGPDPDLATVHAELCDAGLMCFRARARQPFHSPAMNECAVPASATGSARLREPATRLWSCYTGAVLDPGHARDPDFWSTQPARTVHFGLTLDRLLADEGPVDLVEVGPGQSLTSLARRTAAAARGGSTASPSVAGTEPEGHPAGVEALVERFAAGRAGAESTTRTA